MSEDLPRPEVLRDSPEMEALRLLIARPEEIEASLHDVLFADPTCAAGYQALRDANSRVSALGDVQPQVTGLLQRLAVEDTGADPADVIYRLIEAAGRRALDDLTAQARQSADDDEGMRLIDTVRWLKRMLEALRDPRSEPAVAEQLLTWLARQHEESG